MSEPVLNVVADQTPAPAAAQAPAADPTAWMAGVDPAVKDHLVSMNLTDPKAVAQSYSHLQKLMGAGPDNLFKLPTKPMDTPEGKDAWGKIYDKLGRPAKPEEYGLNGEPGKENKFGADFAKTFHELGLSKKQVEAITQKWNATSEAMQKTEVETIKANQDKASAELKAKWGNAYEQNMNLAKKVTKEFPELMTDEVWAGMESALGAAKTIELFHAFMSKTVQNGKFETGSPQNFAGQQFSPEQAKSELLKLSKDSDFSKRLSSGDVDALSRWTKLNMDAAGYQEGA